MNLLKLNQWYLILDFYKAPWTNGRYYNLFFGVFKVLEFPPEGYKITVGKYKGFIINKTFHWDGINIHIKVPYL